MPSKVWTQLLLRDDHQNPYQEFLAIPLGYFTLQLRDCRVFAFIDNDGVMSAIIKIQLQAT